MSFDPRLACRSYSSLALNIPNMDRFPLLVAKTAAKKEDQTSRSKALRVNQWLTSRNPRLYYLTVNMQTIFSVRYTLCTHC